jgi:hypothetical protein
LQPAAQQGRATGNLPAVPGQKRPDDAAHKTGATPAPVGANRPAPKPIFGQRRDEPRPAPKPSARYASDDDVIEGEVIEEVETEPAELPPDKKESDDDGGLKYVPIDEA